MHSDAFDWVQTFLTATSQLTLLTLAKQKQKSFEEAKGAIVDINITCSLT